MFCMFYSLRGSEGCSVCFVFGVLCVGVKGRIIVLCVGE